MRNIATIRRWRHAYATASGARRPDCCNEDTSAAFAALDRSTSSALGNNVAAGRTEQVGWHRGRDGRSG